MIKWWDKTLDYGVFFWGGGGTVLSDARIRYTMTGSLELLRIELVVLSFLFQQKYLWRLKMGCIFLSFSLIIISLIREH